MCSPSAISTIGNLSTTIGKGVNIYQESKNNDYKIEVAKNNALQAQRKALIEEQEGINKSRKQKIAGIELAKKEIAKNSAGGFDLNSDTSILNYQDIISKNYSEANEIQKEYNLRAEQYYQQANSYNSLAQNYQKTFEKNMLNKGLIGIGNGFQVTSDWFDETFGGEVE